jgi:hypothetical protein
MAFKTIVVHVDVDANRDERLRVAEEFVRRHDGHLIGLHPCEPPYLPPSLGELAGPVEADMVEAQRRAARQRSDELRRLFENPAIDRGERAGVIDRLLTIDAAPLPARRTTLKLFDIPEIPCDAVGEIILHDIARCEAEGGGAVDCFAILDLSSRAGVPFVL